MLKFVVVIVYYFFDQNLIWSIIVTKPIMSVNLIFIK